MLTSTLKRKVVKAAAIAAVGTLALPLLSSNPAQADPRAHTDQLVGVGSDTVQAVFNAFAGESNGIQYTPLHTDGTDNITVFSSWDATAPADHTDITCISPRALFNAFQRPNGSTEGKKVVSRAIDGGNYSEAGADAACNNKPTAGIVDFGRSSSAGTNGAGTALTLIPFAGDALTYAYAASAGVTPITDFTQAELQSVFTGGGTPGGGQGTTIRGVLVIPCDIQGGSGTQKDWPGKVGGAVTTSSITLASARCKAIVNGADGTGIDGAGSLEENHLDQLAHKVSASGAPAAEYIVGHGASAFIAQSNGKAPSHLSVGGVTAGLGSINLSGTVTAPYTGTAPNLVANDPFYSSSFGRSVFTVWPTSVVTGNPLQNVKQKALVVGSGSKLCQAVSTLNLFGFQSLGAGCGTTSLTSALF